MVTLDFAATILLAADRRSGLRRVDPFSTPPRCRIRWFSPVPVQSPRRSVRAGVRAAMAPALTYRFFCPSLRSCSGPPQDSSPVQ